MGGPIVRSGASPAFTENWDNIFGRKSGGKKSAVKKKSPKKSAGPAAKKSAKKKPAPAAKKSAKPAKKKSK
jgi:hypothetical protein